jgi:hypothetical protein
MGGGCHPDIAIICNNEAKYSPKRQKKKLKKLTENVII